MADLTSLPLQLHAKKCVCRAIIETPKGCRNKFDYDPDSGLFMLGGLLPEGMMFDYEIRENNPVNCIIFHKSINAYFECEVNRF